jgi:hypothetical protein
MNGSLVLYGGEAAKIVETTVVALYDPASGRIHHTHTVHVHEGGRRVPETQAIQAAYRHARDLGHECDRLTPTVSTHLEHGHLPHRIDPATKAFVRLERPLGHDHVGG